MAVITFDDKDSSLPTSNPRKLWRDVDANQVKNVVNENAGAMNEIIRVAVASGTNTYSATFSPTVASYVNLMRLLIKFSNAPTGASTVNAGPGAKKLYKNPTTQIGDGDFPAGYTAIVTYDSSLDSGIGGLLILGFQTPVLDEDDMASDSATKVPSQQSVKAYVDNGSKDTNRTWTETLVFDKKEIFFAPVIMSGDVNYVLGTGHLVNNSSTARQEIIADGVSAINFSPDFDFITGINNGQVLEAGTYEIYFLYKPNGRVSVVVPGGTSESSSSVQLGAPTSFTANTDGQTEIDLSWGNITNNSGYFIERSLNGVTYSILTTTTADATSFSDTGLSPNTQYWYRITTLGDDVNFIDSSPAFASATTASAGDVTAPIPTWLPLNTATDWPVNKPITITFDEAIRNTDGTSITNLNVASIVTLKKTNSGGANIAFTATIDVTNTIVTITPTPTDGYGGNQLVYVAVNNFEDSTGNEQTSAVSITFTTGTYSYFTKLKNNRVVFGDILDSVFAGTDSSFRILVTLRNASLVGSQRFLCKSDVSSTGNTFVFYSIGADIFFAFYTGPSTNNASRFIKWASALTSAEIDLELRYNGSVDTNDGLDRCELYVDGVLAGSKTLEASTNTLDDINNINTNLCFGITVNMSGVPQQSNYYDGDAKDLQIKSGDGSVTHLNVPVLRSGTDISGNGHNGTWV